MSTYSPDDFKGLHKLMSRRVEIFISNIRSCLIVDETVLKLSVDVLVLTIFYKF